MNAEQIKEALEGRGWKVTIEDLDVVDINGDGLFKCVDGRSSNCDGMRGPKALGGIYALAAVRGVSDIAGLKKIVSEVRAAGYVPSVHGDDHGGAMGCGFFKLWKTGQLTDVAPPEYTADEGRDAVLESGGAYEMLTGEHEEVFTAINLRENTTLEPQPASQRFVVDGWVAGKLGLDVPRYLTLAAETVEKLRPSAMVAKITK